MNVCIIGAGYVGLVTGACFADLGNNVTCVDNDKKKIDALKKLKMPFFEEGLEDMVKRNVKAGRLSFTDSIKEGVKKSLVIFICVGTPPKQGGEADLSYVEKVATEIARNMSSYRLIVEKSTVPVETGKWVRETIKLNVRKKVKFDVASNPEFLREGTAIEDFLNPDRIVIGVGSKKAEKILKELYREIDTEIVVTDINSAELIKHASNSFLATKISFINSISNICERTGADITKVAHGMGLDSRIGESFLKSGVGYGGFCFPKDVDAFVHISGKLGYDFGILKAVRKVNEEQKALFVRKVEDALWIVKGKTIGVLGLSFKPNTDDMRSAPSIDIINSLKENGARIKAYDPHAMKKAHSVIKGVTFCRTAYDAARNSDALVILTEWHEFEVLDLVRVKKLMKNALIIDGRNVFDPVRMKKLGFKYISIGR
ncbi:MAG: UDP-glucose/GDP-mannose dehydrogenase family protein [Candidatus Omnitrophica bacterium]|nr:UDP-glucose/GDP-mannose dehydrogenase family protein [Candidatus Omnitrophota bacterium]MBU4589323.1 UDP-glucose/GDP-mannose dehydrogenase family protein [Candidatus Omnitrophota bacterium]